MLAATLAPARGAPAAGSACERCGLPVDTRHFDRSGFAALPDRGREALLARVQLSPQYCGSLQFFSQYTDQQARQPEAVETPGLHWQILVNHQLLDPYIDLQHIANPWGFGSFELRVRLPEGALVEFVVRRALAAPPLDGLTRVGGRLCGRYWYDESFGARGRRDGHAP